MFQRHHGAKVFWCFFSNAQMARLAKRNPYVAAEQDEAISAQIILLAEHPEIGRTGRLAGTREVVIARTPYIAIYRVKKNEVEILRILHHAQKWPK